MAYERQYYTNGDVLNAEQLNHMEAGIKENSDNIGKLSEDIADKVTLENNVIKFWKSGEEDVLLYSIDVSSIGGTGGLDLENLTLSVTEVNGNQRLSMSDGTTTKTVDIPMSVISDEQIQTAVNEWLNEHPEAVTTVADGSITVEKLSAYKGKIVRNMFGNMGFKFGTLDTSTGAITEDENSMHMLVYTKLEPSTKYYMQKNSNGELLNIAPLEMYFYDSEGTYLSKSYTWDSTFKSHANASYGVYYVKSSKTAERSYEEQPFQLLDEAITDIYPYDCTEIVYAEDVSEEKELIEHIVGENSEPIGKVLTNYFVPSEKIIIPVESGEVITHNLYNFGATFYCDVVCTIRAGYADIIQNNTATGEEPQATSFVVPKGIKGVKVNANVGSYPNVGQSAWYDVENPQIVKGTELIENLPSGTSFRFEEEVKTEIQKLTKEETEEVLKGNGVMSPLNGKKWMVWGDSTSCYASKNYPDYIVERTGCIVTNKAMAGSRVTANEGSGSPIVDSVVNNITADMEVLTLVGGYNDRRSYDASNPNWDWLGNMLNADGTPNTDKTTFYGALNTIASKWFEVCPEATKAFFTIFPCGTNPNGEYETKINGIIKEVANYWCIPCFDAWNEVGLPVRLDYINQTYYMNDRIHPNEEGNRVISTYVQKKLESIMV